MEADNTASFEIRLIKNWPTDQIVNLYKAGGWWKESYDEKQLPALIKQSFAFAIVYDKNKKKAIGMGRVISDGISDAYIQDFIILPEYRNQGLGQQLLQQLIKYCHQQKITWIALIAEPESKQFYQQLGFSTMKDHTPMRFHPEG